MAITLATKGDIEGILALQTQIYRAIEQNPNAHKFLEKQLDDETCSILVVKDGDMIIGTATLYYIGVGIRAKPYGFLEGLVVDEKHRGKGMGGKLFEKIIELAREKGCYKLIFTSGFDREEFHSFYEKLGFGKWGWEFRMDL